jgi:hypothetical protein
VAAPPSFLPSTVPKCSGSKPSQMPGGLPCKNQPGSRPSMTQASLRVCLGADTRINRTIEAQAISANASRTSSWPLPASARSRVTARAARPPRRLSSTSTVDRAARCCCGKYGRSHDPRSSRRSRRGCRRSRGHRVAEGPNGHKGVGWRNIPPGVWLALIGQQRETEIKSLILLASGCQRPRARGMA